MHGLIAEARAFDAHQEVARIVGVLRRPVGPLPPAQVVPVVVEALVGVHLQQAIAPLDARDQARGLHQVACAVVGVALLTAVGQAHGSQAVGLVVLIGCGSAQIVVPAQEITLARIGELPRPAVVPLSQPRTFGGLHQATAVAVVVGQLLRVVRGAALDQPGPSQAQTLGLASRVQHDGRGGVDPNVLGRELPQHRAVLGVHAVHISVWRAARAPPMKTLDDPRNTVKNGAMPPQVGAMPRSPAARAPGSVDRPAVVEVFHQSLPITMSLRRCVLPVKAKSTDRSL